MLFYKDWSLMRRMEAAWGGAAAISLLICVESLFPTKLEGPLALLLLLDGLFYFFAVRLPMEETERALYRYNRGFDSAAVLQGAVPYSDRQEQAFYKMTRLLDDHQVIRLSNRQAQYLALQNQINPHFLYNTLEAIRGDALSEGLVNLAEITEALATFFRYTISNMETQVTLEEELANAENYFAIQKYRFGDRISMRILTEPGSEEAGRCLIPKLTLQPIIENAVLHGLEQKVGAGEVTVGIRLGPQLLVEVTDDGVGIAQERLLAMNRRLRDMDCGDGEGDRSRGGIALINVQNRIRLLYGERWGLRVSSIAGVGTRVQVELPVLRREEASREC